MSDSALLDPVVIERHDHVSVVRINRPHALNAINQPVWDALGAAWAALDADPQVRAIVLTGTGDRAFCAGADLKAIAHHEFRTDWSAHRTEAGWGFAGITTHPISTPTIAAVNGLALGGGFELALACDLVVAGSAARFGLPEVHRGLIAGGGGALRLPRRIPRALALELILTGDSIDAARAADLGLVNRVTDPGAELTGALALAARIAANAPLAVQASKRIALGLTGATPVGTTASTASTANTASTVSPGAAGIDGEDWTGNDAEVRAILTTSDAKEGPLAFAQKRTPNWTAS